MKEPKGILLAIWIGLLSSLAGAVNVTTLWLVATPSTHMTGNLTQLVLALARGGRGSGQPSGLDLAGLYSWEHAKWPLIL